MDFDQTAKSNIFAIVAAYRKATGKSVTQISHEFYGRGDFFKRFKANERTISMRSFSRMLDKFRKQWPDGADWPMTRAIEMDLRN